MLKQIVTKAAGAAVLAAFFLGSCQPGPKPGLSESMKAERHFGIGATDRILVTSESGDRQAEKENIVFREGTSTSGTVIEIFPEQPKQVMDGIGSSFTESSAFVLAHLDPEIRRALMEEIWGEQGANFPLARTHIGACDFTVEGGYSYLDSVGDTEMEHFSLHRDKEGFSRDRYPGIVDEQYDLLPMLQEAFAIKDIQKDKALRLYSSAWTAPSWMKDIETWHIPGSPENNWQGTGGSLKPEYVELYARYLLRYLEAYKSEGVPVYGLTPVNEPHGNSGQWESMHFSPESQNEFIKRHLGPALKNSSFHDSKLLIFDQNRDGMEHWTDEILGDPETAPYVSGTAVHWYESTEKVHEEVFDRVKAKFPDFSILHTEGCIDDLGKPASDAIGDPEGFQEKDWFGNDSFWWNRTATDWAYTASWAGEGAKDHPMYVPVHRYARNIIVSIDHWLQGWIDWNIILDHRGGPNHVGNFCGAPIMIDTDTKEIYRTPIFYVLSQLSRSIRPGDRALATEQRLSSLPGDALHACATVNDGDLLSVQLLNTTKEAIRLDLQIGGQYAELSVPANAVQTVQIQLNHRRPMSLDSMPDRESPFVERPFQRGSRTMAISYGAYRAGQAPGVKGPGEAQILEDLNILKEHFELIRVYGSDADSRRVLNVIEHYGLPIRVMLGVWLENETGKAEKQASNREQVLNAIALANRYSEIVAAVNVGNESQVFWSWHRTDRDDLIRYIRYLRAHTPVPSEIVAAVNVGNESQVFWSWHRTDRDDLIRYIRYLRAHTPVPVTTADDYNFWNKPEAKEIETEVDFIVTHIYPLWNGKTLAESIPWLDSTYQDLKQRYPEKILVLGEIGWATRYNPEKKGPGEQGSLIRGKVGLEAQENFLGRLYDWSQSEDVTTFLFEAFDEAWKGGGEASGPDEVEKHWGIYYEDRSPKQSFLNFLEK